MKVRFDFTFNKFIRSKLNEELVFQEHYYHVITLINISILGITGEKSIYKKRGEQDPEPGAPQEKPKRLRLLVDLSGSMYRFNGEYW